jgi:hypothetical protein
LELLCFDQIATLGLDNLAVSHPSLKNTGRKKRLVTVKPRSWCNIWVPVEDPVFFLLLWLSSTLILEQWRNCLLGISQSETIMRKLSPPPPFSPSFLVNKCSNIAYKSSSDDYIYVQESLQELAFKMQSLKSHTMYWAHGMSATLSGTLLAQSLSPSCPTGEIWTVSGSSNLNCFCQWQSSDCLPEDSEMLLIVPRFHQIVQCLHS